MPKLNKITGRLHNSTYYRHVKKEINSTNRKLSEFFKLAKASKVTLPIVKKNELKNKLVRNYSENIQNNTGEIHSKHLLSVEIEESTSKFVEDNFEKKVNGEQHNEKESSDVEMDEEVETKLSFTESLKIWALKNKITHSALNELLNLLRQSNHSYLPTDSRTLLETPVNVNIIPMGSGYYWYNGLNRCLRLNLKSLQKPLTELNLSFNIDGLPVCNSSKTQFWPILCKVDNTVEIKNPMIVAIYCGESKPNLQPYLTPFVDELTEILKNGMQINGVKVHIKIRCFICDTPARSYIKG